MKEVAKYQCEYCHTEYREKNKCEECENNHKIKPKIDKKIYRAYNSEHSGYPYQINIKFENGEVIAYKRG